MTDYRTIYSECISGLHDRKRTLRDSSAEKLIPYLVENDVIHTYIQGLSDALLTASEKGLSPNIFSRAFCRIAAIDPTLNCFITVFTIMINHLKQARNTPEEFSQLFSSLGFILCMVNNFNEIFDDLSDIFFVMVDLLTDILSSKSSEYLPYAPPIVYGLSIAYLSLPDNHRSGWAYDRYVPLMIYFLTRNPDIDTTMTTIPYIISGLLSAVQSNKLDIGGFVTAAYPEVICNQYQLDDDHTNDDGYYTLDGEDSVRIPLIHYELSGLQQRINMIFDRSSISLENDYSDSDLDNIREQLQDLFQFIQTDSISSGDIADTLATHRNFDIVPDKYSTIEGRNIYHGLERFVDLPWSDASFMPYMGEIMSAVEILNNVQPKQKIVVDVRTRRLTKKQRDIEQNHNRLQKYAYLYHSDE